MRPTRHPSAGRWVFEARRRGHFDRIGCRWTRGVRGHDSVVCMQGSRSPRVMNVRCEPPAGLWVLGRQALCGAQCAGPLRRQSPSPDSGRELMIRGGWVSIRNRLRSRAETRRTRLAEAAPARSAVQARRPPTLYRTKITKAECAALIEVNTKVVVCRHCGRVNARSSGSSFDAPVSARRYQRLADAQR
jgi:hypothetical protein